MDFKGCFVCKKKISIKITSTRENSYFVHKKCFKCKTCKMFLSNRMLCLLHQRKLYCDTTCIRFAPQSTKCVTCADTLTGNDIIRRINNQNYHLNCFKCTKCNRILRTGQRIHIVKGKFFCDLHPKKNKLIRTKISSEQQKKLMLFYKKSKYINNLTLEKISNSVNLPTKVVKVWFQNKRARN